MFHDSDADAELVDFGGSGRASGGARAAGQIHLSGSLRRGVYGRVRKPVPRMWARSARSISTPLRCRPSPLLGDRQYRGQPAGDDGLHRQHGVFNPLKTSYPEVIGTARIDQPWGHVQIGGFVRNDPAQ